MADQQVKVIAYPLSFGEEPGWEWESNGAWLEIENASEVVPQVILRVDDIFVPVSRVASKSVIDTENLYLALYVFVG